MADFGYLKARSTTSSLAAPGRAPLASSHRASTFQAVCVLAARPIEYGFQIPLSVYPVEQPFVTDAIAVHLAQRAVDSSAVPA